jgi:hypothetical protein
MLLVSLLIFPFCKWNTSQKTDSKFEMLEKKYQRYLDLHSIEEIFGVFQIKQSPPIESLKANSFGIPGLIFLLILKRYN